MNTQYQETVGELAATSLAAVNVMERHGIDYCCGGKRPLDEVCREKGLSVEQLRNEIDQANSERTNRTRDWAEAPLADLIRHIVSTHHEYLKLELPRVGQRLQKVVQAHGARDPLTLNEIQSVYQSLWQELDLHMHKEELMLFPAIERYEAAARNRGSLPPVPFGSFGNPIAVMEHEHDSAGRALQRIREITGNFEPPEYACPTYRSMLAGLEALDTDLRTHIHLENNILFPRAIALEKDLSR